MNDGEPYERYWSCGPKKKEVGDAFLLMRLGVEPKGIIGCGYISSTPFVLPHWDPAEWTSTRITDTPYTRICRW